MLLYADINKIYTEIVSDYIGKGYYLNTGTMGSCGSDTIMNTDLTNGEEIIRVSVGTCEQDRPGKSWGHIDGIRLFVGRAKPEHLRMYLSNDHFRTLWNTDFEIIDEHKWFKLGRSNRCGYYAYGTFEEAVAADRKVIERYSNHRTANDYSHDFNSDKAKEMALAWVKKQPKCKTVKLAQIGRVYRESDQYGRAVYKVALSKGNDVIHMTIR